MSCKLLSWIGIFVGQSFFACYHAFMIYSRSSQPATSPNPSFSSVRLLSVFVLGIVFVIWASIYGSRWFFSHVMEHSQPVPGDATHYDPVARYPDALAYAGSDARLLSIKARFVRSDGTMDLTAAYEPGPSTVYTFVHDAPPAKNTPPPGVRSADRDFSKQQVVVTLSRPNQTLRTIGFGGSSFAGYKYVNQGMRRDEGRPGVSTSLTVTDAPRCSFADLWKQALHTQNSIPRDAVATIEYEAGRYRFQVVDQPQLSFSSDCHLVP